MTSKKWFVMFLLSVMIVALLIPGLNIVVDPFNVFGDKVFNWHSYNFTKNPRVAKTTYLDQNNGKFDSYLIGSSATSSLSVNLLNQYMDADFYNLFMYGADMYDVTQTVFYVIDNYKVKNIVLNLSVLNASNYNYESDPFTDNLHAKVDHSSLVKFYLKYMYANPKYSFEKIGGSFKDTYLPQYFDVFDVRTGAYDKSVRDVEQIQDIEAYKSNYPVFVNYPEHNYNLNFIDVFIDDMRKITTLCEKKDINLKVVFSPIFYQQAKGFNINQIKHLYVRLAEIVDFWDFSVFPVTADPRFYYDATHFRNSLGDMALAKMFGDDTVFVPEEFGSLVTLKNAEEQAGRYRSLYTFEDSSYTAKVPVLMYHHLAEESLNSETIAGKKFEEHMKALSEAGYTGVSIKQLADYVEKGTELPQKPIVITFDDGYSSNYEIAYPILKKYNMKAAIFIIGSSAGKDTYKDTENPIIPHFGYEEAKVMIDSGLIEIQSHTYDMHQSEKYEQGAARTSAVKLDEESEHSYIETLRQDFARSRSEIEKSTGQKVFAFAYPLGEYNNLSEAVLKEMGIKITLSTKPGINTLIKGLPQCLQAIKRFSISGEITPEALIELLND